MTSDWNGAPGRIRTSDPQIRSLVFYPAELRVQSSRGHLIDDLVFGSKQKRRGYQTFFNSGSQSSCIGISVAAGRYYTLLGPI